MTHTPEFVVLDPRKVTPSPWNTNVVSHENEVKLRSSIERHGMFKPILVREYGEYFQCIGGWHRCEQSIELGYEEIPAINLGPISDEKAKEISLADNARYGIDDTLRLSELLGELDTQAIEDIMPWSHQDIVALTASLAVDIENLDLDDPIIPDADEPDPDPAPTKPAKTHQVMRFRCSVADAARISAKINETMVREGFTTEDDLTNAGDALAFLLGATDDESDDDDATA